MDTRRWRTFNGLRNWLLPLAASLMLVTILIPAEFWRRPVDAAVYRGFDPNLIYVDEGGESSVKGIVEVSEDRLRLTAVPNSAPTVHLVTSPMSFRASLGIRVLQTGTADIPLSVGVWSPRTNSGYFLDFGSIGSNIVMARTIRQGSVVRSQTLGEYSPGLLYRLDAEVDRRLGSINIRLSGVDTPPGGGGVLRLVGGPANREYRDVMSRPVPVTAGREYVFGGLVKLVEGSDAYKVVVQWLDERQRFLGSANDWRSIRELHGWTRKQFRTKAPPGSVYARLNLGSGNETQLVFASLFLYEANKPGANLLSNGDFQQGNVGWVMAGSTTRALDVLSAYTQMLESSVTAPAAPELFDSRRLSLSVAVASQGGITRAVLENYSLSLPNQRWQALRVEDLRAEVLIVTLTLLGMLLCIGHVVARTNGRIYSPMNNGLRLMKAAVMLSTRRLPPIPLGLLLVALVYAILNGLLFRLGSLPFDMMAAKIWTYIATRYSPFALYHLPNTVGLAKVWGGVPYHEAVFPYHQVMAYYFTFSGWLYRQFLNGPGPLLADTFQLEWLLKSFNVLFGAIDAILIYLILRVLEVKPRTATVAALLFLFNPAVIFSMAVWGQNHVVSLFPLLLAIWAAENRRPTGAWIALAASALTRPQMLIPVSLIALALLRKFPPKENVYAVSWTIVIGFVLLVPFALAVSPSLPVDILANQLYVQEGGGNEEALTTVSLGAFSIWPLVTRLVAGESGLARFSLSSLLPLVGQLTYLRVSQILVLGAISGTAGLLLTRRSAANPGEYLQLLALGSTAFLFLKTGLAATHFVIALPLLILCVTSIEPKAYYALVSIWTIVTYVSLYGSVAYAIQLVPDLAPALNPETNRITQFHAYLYGTDWSITVHTLLGGLVVFLLALTAVRSARRGASSAPARTPAQV